MEFFENSIKSESFIGISTITNKFRDNGKIHMKHKQYVECWLRPFNRDEILFRTTPSGTIKYWHGHNIFHSTIVHYITCIEWIESTLVFIALDNLRFIHRDAYMRVWNAMVCHHRLQFSIVTHHHVTRINVYGNVWLQPKPNE